MTQNPTSQAIEFGKSIRGNEKTIGILKGILIQMKTKQDKLWASHECPQEFLDNAFFIQFINEALEAAEQI